MLIFKTNVILFHSDCFSLHIYSANVGQLTYPTLIHYDNITRWSESSTQVIIVTFQSHQTVTSAKRNRERAKKNTPTLNFKSVEKHPRFVLFSTSNCILLSINTLVRFYRLSWRRKMFRLCKKRWGKKNDDETSRKKIYSLFTECSSTWPSPFVTWGWRSCMERASLLL